jgi:hypothetical protein
MFSSILLSMFMLAAQEPVEASAPTAVEILDASYQSAIADYYEKLDAMYDSGDFTDIEHPIETYFDQFRAFAKNANIPRSARAHAQIWCVENFGEKNWAHPDKVFSGLAKLFTSEFADSDYALEFTTAMRRVRLETAFKIEVVEALSNATSSDPIKAHCMLACAYAYADSDDQKMADTTVDELMEKYPESKAAAAAGPLLVKRQLQVSKVAPALGGVDVDGKERHLIDTRGKVTFVVFWGFW